MLITLLLLLYDWPGYQVGTYGDDGSYVAVTDSLLSNVNYGMLLDPGEIEPTQFPFVYPLLLAPLRAWLPGNLDALRIISFVATLALLVVLFWGWGWIGRGLSYWWGLALTAVLGMSPVTILHGRTVMSEAVFLLFVLLLVLWGEYVVERSPRAWGVLLGVIAVGTVYSRTVGWAFLVPALGYLTWKMRGRIWPQIGVAVGTMAVILALVVTTTTVRPIDLLPQEYITQLSVSYNSPARRAAIPSEQATVQAQATAPTSVNTALQFVFRVGNSMLGHLDIADKLPFQMERAVTRAANQLGMPFIRYIPLLGAAALISLGSVTWVRRTGVTLLQVVVPLYILMLMIWAWNGSRLMYPAQPQIFLALMLGVYVLGEWMAARVLGGKRHILAAGTITFVLLWLGAWIWLDLSLTRTMLLPSDKIARAAILRQYIPSDAVVLSTRAETDFLYAPQSFIEVPRGYITSEAIRDYLIAYRIDYVVTQVGLVATEENTAIRSNRMLRFVKYSQPLIQARALVELYSNATTDLSIYQVDKDVLTVLKGE